MDTTFLTRGSLRIKVIKVESPTLIWVHIEHAREELNELIDDLTRRMERKGRLLRERPDHVIPNELVAVREGKHWQRGIVTRVEGGGTVEIALRDWGRVIRRSVLDIHILEDRFKEVEWKAIPCGLAHLQPVGSRPRWSRKARELTRVLIERQEGWMRIIQPIRSDAVLISLELRPENEYELNNLNKLLIQMGCAERSKEKIVIALSGIV
jgi:hypothetical protein